MFKCKEFENIKDLFVLLTDPVDSETQAYVFTDWKKDEKGLTYKAVHIYTKEYIESLVLGMSCVEQARIGRVQEKERKKFFKKLQSAGVRSAIVNNKNEYDIENMLVQCFYGDREEQELNILMDIYTPNGNEFKITENDFVQMCDIFEKVKQDMMHNNLLKDESLNTILKMNNSLFYVFVEWVAKSESYLALRKNTEIFQNGNKLELEGWKDENNISSGYIFLDKDDIYDEILNQKDACAKILTYTKKGLHELLESDSNFNQIIIKCKRKVVRLYVGTPYKIKNYIKTIEMENGANSSAIDSFFPEPRSFRNRINDNTIDITMISRKNFQWIPKLKQSFDDCKYFTFDSGKHVYKYNIMRGITSCLPYEIIKKMEEEVPELRSYCSK